MPLKITSSYSSYSQGPADFWSFTKKMIIKFLKAFCWQKYLPWHRSFWQKRISYKTGVRQDSCEWIVLSFPLFVQLPLQCNFYLDSNNKNMHFQQGFHQHQKVDFIFSPFLSGSCSLLYSYTVVKLQFLEEKKHHLFQVISVGDWPKTPSPQSMNFK